MPPAGPHDLRPLAGGAARKPNLAIRYLSRFDDGEVIRWAFCGLLIGAIGVLGLDLRDLVATNGWGDTGIEAPAPAEPVLPPTVDGDSNAPPNDPRRFVTTEAGDLGKPMSFTLAPGGVLRAEGSIEPGAAARLAGELSQRGEYVKTVSLNSPGGALDDAMAMGMAIRERGMATEVADGSICASSCPLAFAGGRTRTAGDKAAIGVHQFYAAGAETVRPAQIMSDAQATTARITRHLASLDVDPALWLHALDTPPRSLYYFSAEELRRYRLVTGPQGVARR